MRIARIPGAQVVIGQSQGYLGLPVLIGFTEDGVPTMTTAWEPTPAELAALNAGATVRVQLLGIAHPPIIVIVGEAPADDPDPAPKDPTNANKP